MLHYQHVLLGYMTMSAQILNLAGYLFVPLEAKHLEDCRQPIREAAMEAGLKGSILLTTEGINVFIAGPEENVRHFLTVFFEMIPEASALNFRPSYSEKQPFKRMLVKLKKEIIAFDQPSVKPSDQTVPHLSPEDFKAWYEEGKDMLVLDTRNTYEFELGTFKDAMTLPIESFKAFPEAVKAAVDVDEQRPIVMFCTGGVRCEKAGEWMRQAGYNNVYQLDRGILGYFEKCGREHYEGECFVFDKRVALDPELKETMSRQCFACRRPMSEAEYELCAGQCPCGATVTDKAAV